MKKKSSLQKLDIVLSYLVQNIIRFRIIEEIDAGIPENYFKNPNELEAIVNKLLKDGYVEVKEEPYTPITKYGYGEEEILRSYKITFEGIFFSEYVGGYEAQDESNLSESIRLDKLDKIQRENTANMVSLTRWIAFGTIVAAVYYLHQLLLIFQAYCKCEFYWQR